MQIHHAAFAAVLACAAGSAAAQDFRVGDIKISHPFARATSVGQPNGGAFMTITNEGDNDRLLSASAPVAKSVELHQSRLEGDVMKMRQVDGIDIAAGNTVELKPSGYHVMFLGLNEPLVAGTRFPMILNFRQGGAVSISVTVEAPGAGTQQRADAGRDRNATAPAPAAPT